MAKRIGCDYGVFVTEEQASVLDAYTSAKTPAQYAAARATLYDHWNWNPDWVVNVDEFWAAMGNPESLPLYRGWSEGADIESASHTSWTIHKRVAVWHSTLWGRVGVVATISVTKEDLAMLMIWASDDIEGEVMIHDPDLMIDASVPQETIPARIGQSLKEFME